MTKPRNKAPIESFGPELFNALIEGSKRTIDIPTIYRQAVVFRIRAHQLRHRMREDNHPLYSVAARTRITITWDANTETVINKKKIKFPKDPNTPVVLTIAPHDSQFAAALSAAGIDVKTPLNRDLIGGATTDEEPIPTLDDLLKDFK